MFAMVILYEIPLENISSVLKTRSIIGSLLVFPFRTRRRSETRRGLIRSRDYFGEVKYADSVPSSETRALT